MTKKISIWLAIFLVIFATVITFQLTIIFGDVFFRDEPAGQVPTDYTEKTEEPTAPDEPADKTLGEEITERVAEKIGAIAELYANYYVGDLDIDDLVEGAAHGFVAYTGDKYGAYHNAEDYAALQQGYSGEFAGIGVSVTYNPDLGVIEVLNVMPNSPADEGGLLPSDLIIAVGGENVIDLGYNEAVAKVRGEVGTEVTVTIARGESYEEQFDVTLTRRIVEEQSVTYEAIELPNLVTPIAYIRLMDFNDTTAAQFADALRAGTEDKAHGYIVDVRGNGGGELSSIMEILDMLLPEGPIVRIQYKDGTEQVYESDANEFKAPMVVLANGNTASAAELFVSALKDYQRAIVVGTVTYGKGTVQSLIPFDDGSALRISTSMYAPPYSDNYEGIGVTPDIESELDEQYRGINLFKLAHENDAQLQAALALYK